MDGTLPFGGNRVRSEGLVAVEAFLSDAWPDCAAWFHYGDGLVLSRSERGTGAERALDELGMEMADRGLVSSGLGSWSRPGIAAAGSWALPGSAIGLEREGPILAARLRSGRLMGLPFDRAEDVPSGVLAAWTGGSR